MVASVPTQAQSLGELIPELLETHNLIKASQADLEAASQSVKSSQGAWFPQLNLTAHYGAPRAAPKDQMVHEIVVVRPAPCGPGPLAPAARAG